MDPLPLSEIITGHGDSARSLADKLAAAGHVVTAREAQRWAAADSTMKAADIAAVVRLYGLDSFSARRFLEWAASVKVASL